MLTDMAFDLRLNLAQPRPHLLRPTAAFKSEIFGILLDLFPQGIQPIKPVGPQFPCRVCDRRTEVGKLACSVFSSGIIFRHGRSFHLAGRA